MRLTVNGAVPYEVCVENGALGRLGALLSGSLSGAEKVLTVSDDTVDALYGKRAEKALRDAGFAVSRFSFPHGEQSKTAVTWLSVLNALAAADFSRKDAVIAIGGGVTGDMAGFAAASWMRGIRFVQVPTTLLSAVDAGIGGKTAVDLPAGKNLIGAFHDPAAVICDPLLMDTLPREEWQNGLGETVKTAFIGDAALAESLLSARETGIDREDVIARCLRVKAEFVQRDPFDTGVRRLLNLGHTAAHAMEALSGYGIPHGLAVAKGTALTCRAAARYGLCGKEVTERAEEIFRALDIDITVPFGAEELAGAALKDKKRAGSSITLAVPLTVGRCALRTLPVEELAAFFAAGTQA